MKQRTRIHYTESQKALMWDRWQKGDSLQHIAQLFDRNHSSVQRILAEHSGMRPAQRRRSRLSLTLAEREEISRAVVAGQSIRSIATSLGGMHLPRSVAKSSATVISNAIGQVKPTKRLGTGRFVPSPVN